MTRAHKWKRDAAWWLAAVLAVGFVVWHAQSMSRYLDRVTSERFAAQEAPLSCELIQGGNALDGMTWIRMSEEMAERGEWRFRATASDNAPEGREVYWSSGWAWWLRLSGSLWSRASGVPFETALEHSARWVQVPVLLCLILGLGTWMARRWGSAAAVVMVMGMVGHRAFYEGFLPGNPDHHGVIGGCSLGMVMALLMGGAGWWDASRSEDGAGLAKSMLPADEQRVKRSMLVSAMFGGVGMWFSAASMIPVIAGIGVAGTVASVVLNRRLTADGLRVSASAWRLWGCAGAGIGVIFYLLENFPDRLGWRMEVNHPVYCLAWWGAGECIALTMERIQGATRLRGLGVARWSAGLVAVASPLVVLAWGGAGVFLPADPLIGEVYRYVSELESMGERITKMGFWYYLDYAGLHPLLLAAAGVVWFTVRSPATRLLLGVAGGLALLLMVLGWWQHRWLLIGSGPLIVLASMLPLVAHAGWRRGLVLVSVSAVFLLTPGRIANERRLVERKGDVQAVEAMQLLYRDIARVLAADSVGRRIVLLASPDGSVSISYYTAGSSVGTLYWENVEGMRRAAVMYAAKDDAAALEGLKRAGVTHIALVSVDNGIAEYVEAARTLGVATSEAEAFASRLQEDRATPLWLRPIDYAAPPQFARLAPTVRLYAVDEDQPAAEAHYRHGLALAGRKKYDQALSHLWAATALAPDKPGPWFRIAEILLTKREYAEACDLMIMGVRLVAPEERPAAYREAASLFSRLGAAAEAARLRSLASAPP